MKKVVYSVTKVGRTENTKITGVGYITDDELITAQISKNGKAYIRTYDCIKSCHPIPNSTNEFKGAYSSDRQTEQSIEGQVRVVSNTCTMIYTDKIALCCRLI